MMQGDAVPQLTEKIVESEDQMLEGWGGALSWEKQVGRNVVVWLGDRFP
jgi:hypothetical protein